MYKKLKYTFLILCSLICVHIFFFNNLYAMTQKEVGEVIATFALNFQKAPDGGHTWTYDYNAANRAQAYKGVKHSDGTYHADCVGWVSMCLHQSIGLDAPNVSNGTCGFVTPTKYDGYITYDGRRDGSVIAKVTGELMPGDILQNSHHVMVYVGKIDGQDTIIHSYKNGVLGYDTFASYASWNNTSSVDINGTYTNAWRITESYAAGIDKSQVKTSWNGTGGDYSWEGSSSGSTGGAENLENFEGNPNFKPDEDDTKKDYRVVNPNDKLPIYKHILLTEKYNFNNIQWKRYGHGNDGTASPTKIDLELGLKYPSDDQNTKLGKFVSLVLPYIQTWYIPLGMYSGILTSESGKMIYSGNSGSASGEANYSGSDNVEKVWNFLTSKGLSEVQTAAILGNMYQESGVNPSSVNSSSGAFGICQWLGGRKSNLANFANSENKDMTDITLQLDFLWYEISGENPSVPPDMFASNFETFKSITDIDEATVYFCKKFERCGSHEANNTRRKNKANEYYNTYQGTSPSGSGTSEEESENGDKGKNSDVKIPKAAKNINFPYSLIKNGYHDIIVNRYDLQTYSLSTKYKEYMKYQNRSVGTVRKRTITTVDSEGKVLRTTTNAYVVSCDSDKEVSKQKVNTRKGSNGNVNPMLEDFVSSSTNVDTKYYLNRALTFDMLYQNEFDYTKYNDEDVESRSNADSESVVNRTPYKEKINEENRFTASDMKGNSVESIASSVNGTVEKSDSKTTTTRSKGQDGKTITTTTVVETYTVTGEIFTIHDGEEIYVDRTWEDKLSQSSSDSKQLDYDEMIKFNKNEEGNSNRDAISQEEFEKNKDHEYRKYRIMGRDGTINYIDFINSNPKLIKTYLNKGSEYSKYMGYVKNDDLLMSYNVLRKLIEKTKDDADTVPYAYFISMGFNMGYSNSSEIDSKASNSKGFGWPVDLTNNDGARVINCIFPYTAGYGAAHGAIDIAPGEGANTIIAAKDGKIKRISKSSSGYGNSILIEHEDGYYTRYSHLSSINSNMVEGLEVKKGQPMGYMGNTGNSTAKHLDFEIYKDGTASSNRIDPLDFYVTEPEYGSIDPSTITKIPSGYVFKSEKGGGEGFSVVGTKLSREEWVQKAVAYANSRRSDACFKDANIMGQFYDTCVGKGVNPEYAFATAVTEQGLHSNVGNYWGLGVYNGQGELGHGSMLTTLGKYCDTIVKYQDPASSYYSMIMSRYEERKAVTENGGANPNGYGTPDTMAGIQSIYSSLGKHITGSSGAGGYYYLDPAVAGITGIYSTHDEFMQLCKNVGGAHASGKNVTPWEDAQYTAWQCQGKIDVAKQIFGDLAGTY